jgi:hypothetical protein
MGNRNTDGGKGGARARRRPSSPTLELRRPRQMGRHGFVGQRAEAGTRSSDALGQRAKTLA